MTNEVLGVVNTLECNIALEESIVPNIEGGVCPKQFRIFKGVSINEMVPVAKEHIAVSNRLKADAALNSTYSRDNMPMSYIFYNTTLISISDTDVVIGKVI